MKVELISYTPNPIQQMYLAATRCVTAGEVKPSDPETMKRVVKKCIESGHLTVCEFVDFTFSIEGITRSCSHQLVRHRHASFCQMSERRVPVGTKEEYETVKHWKETKERTQEAAKVMDKYFQCDNAGILASSACSFLNYWEQIEQGIPEEQARSVLPQCTLTNLLMHVNFRSLIEMSKLRLCRKAESEIRVLFQNLKTQIYFLMQNTPSDEGLFLCKFLDPKCIWIGWCNESGGCELQLPVKKVEDLK